MDEGIKLIFESNEIITKKVMDHKTSGAIYLPKKYIGREVKVIIPNGKKDEGTNTSG